MSEIEIHNFNDIKAYFEALVGMTSKIKSFKFGGFNRIIESLKSEIDYPCLFLELPEKSFDGGLSTGLQKEYKIAFALISSVPKDDYDKQDELVFNALENYIEQLIRKIAIDFDMEEDIGQFSLDPLYGLLHDNCYGWRVEFELVEDSKICKDESFWDQEETVNYFAPEFSQEFK
ncbi:hypothetical protein [Flexithrix dorotheae]|uniref:hypothetical protein n=1 Tax=Flexithrix dorotheae TaxID=70993 RepID=UPI000372E48E|nr:hypothetical protein [Flexithrix dorotheae]